MKMASRVYGEKCTAVQTDEIGQQPLSLWCGDRNSWREGRPSKLTKLDSNHYLILPQSVPSDIQKRCATQLRLAL
jgi:hypothetical protein